MGRLGSFLRLNRSVLYLIEPLVAFFAAAALVLFFQPQGPVVPVRLMELHAQDVLSIMQAGGFEVLFSDSGAAEQIDALVHALNPNYGWQLEISDGDSTKALGSAPEGDVVSASRNLVRNGKFFTIRLNIFYG